MSSDLKIAAMIICGIVVVLATYVTIVVAN